MAFNAMYAIKMPLRTRNSGIYCDLRNKGAYLNTVLYSPWVLLMKSHLRVYRKETLCSQKTKKKKIILNRN